MDQAQKDYFYSKKFTLKGRMFYPKLVTPEANDRGQLKYNMLFAWDINDGSQNAISQSINEFLMTAKQKFAPTIPAEHFNIPVKKWGVYQRMDGKPVHGFLENSFWLNASSGEQFPPVVVDGQQQPVVNPAEIYSGRNVLFNFSFYMYSANGKNGIATNIGAVMLQEGGDKEAGSGAVNLNDAFGSFQNDMNGGGAASFPQGDMGAQNTVAQNAPEGGGFDPVTGQPIQAAPAAQAGGFDPVTGQPIQAAKPQPKGFDPMTGQPIY